MMNLTCRAVIPRKGDLVSDVTSGASLGYGAVRPTIEPEPNEDEREAILAALAEAPAGDARWAAAALREGVEDDELDP